RRNVLFDDHDVDLRKAAEPGEHGFEIALALPFAIRAIGQDVRCLTHGAFYNALSGARDASIRTAALSTSCHAQSRCRNGTSWSSNNRAKAVAKGRRFQAK